MLKSSCYLLSIRHHPTTTSPQLSLSLVQYKTYSGHHFSHFHPFSVLSFSTISSAGTQNFLSASVTLSTKHPLSWSHPWNEATRPRLQQPSQPTKGTCNCMFECTQVTSSLLSSSLSSLSLGYSDLQCS